MASSTTTQRPDVRECVACLNTFSVGEGIELPCTDFFCGPCLEKTFRYRLYLTCCKTSIDFEDVRSHLSIEVQQNYEAKLEEHAAFNKLYCHVPTCSTFIPNAPSSSFSVQPGTCPRCAAATCSGCKQAAHTRGCQPDRARKLLFELSEKEGWIECQQCENMVSKHEGCDEIECLCGCVFCYKCGRQYGEVDCMISLEDPTHRDCSLWHCVCDRELSEGEQDQNDDEGEGDEEDKEMDQEKEEGESAGGKEEKRDHEEGEVVIPREMHQKDGGAKVRADGWARAHIEAWDGVKLEHEPVV